MYFLPEQNKNHVMPHFQPPPPISHVFLVLTCCLYIHQMVNTFVFMVNIQTFLYVFSSFALPMFLHPRPYTWFTFLLPSLEVDTLPSDLSNSCSSETLFLPHYCMIGYLDIKITLPVIFPQCLFQDNLASFINLNSFIYNLFSLLMIVNILYYCAISL